MELALILILAVICIFLVGVTGWLIIKTNSLTEYMMAIDERVYKLKYPEEIATIEKVWEIITNEKEEA